MLTTHLEVLILKPELGIPAVTAARNSSMVAAGSLAAPGVTAFTKESRFLLAAVFMDCRCSQDDVKQQGHVSSTLYVVFSAQGIDSAPGRPILPNNSWRLAKDLTF